MKFGKIIGGTYNFSCLSQDFFIVRTIPTNNYFCFYVVGY